MRFAHILGVSLRDLRQTSKRITLGDSGAKKLKCCQYWQLAIVIGSLYRIYFHARLEIANVRFVFSNN